MTIANNQRKGVYRPLSISRNGMGIGGDWVDSRYSNNSYMTQNPPVMPAEPIAPVAPTDNNLSPWLGGWTDARYTAQTGGSESVAMPSSLFSGFGKLGDYMGQAWDWIKGGGQIGSRSFFDTTDPQGKTLQGYGPTALAGGKALMDSFLGWKAMNSNNDRFNQSMQMSMADFQNQAKLANLALMERERSRLLGTGMNSTQAEDSANAYVKKYGV